MVLLSKVSTESTLAGVVDEDDEKFEMRRAADERAAYLNAYLWVSEAIMVRMYLCVYVR